MWRYYLKLAHRNLSRRKLLSVVNISGLTLAMTCSIFTFLFIKDELTFETVHERAAQIYRIAGSYEHGNNEGKTPNALTNFQLGLKLKSYFPEIQEVARIHIFDGLIQYKQDKHFEKKMCFADNSLFRIFSFELSGDQDPLSKPNTVVISQPVAERYFGSQNPFGKIIENNGQFYEVTGIVKPKPANSHLNFDLIFSMENSELVFPEPVRVNLSSIYVYTYFLIHKDGDVNHIEKQLTEFTIDHFGKSLASQMDFFLQPLLDIHLYSNISNEIQSNGDIKYLYIFGLMAGLLLMAAGINYVNLTMAFNFSRVKSFGVIKVLGSSRGQLAAQLLGESLLISMFSITISLLTVAFLLPHFNELSDKNIHLDYLAHFEVVFGCVLFGITIGFLAGLYPSALIATLNPIPCLKGETTNRNQSFSLKDVLVVIQFTISIALIISTIIIYYQFSFLVNKDLGLKPKNTLVIPIHTREFLSKYPTFKNELLKHQAIKAVSASSERLTEPFVSWRQYSIEGVNDNSDEINVHTLIVDYDFFKTLEVAILEGRDFSKEFSSDPYAAYIVNKEFLNSVNINTLAIGRDVFGITYTDQGGRLYKQAKIIGVVNDFHNESLRSKIEPLFFSLVSDLDIPIKTIYIKISSEDMRSTIALINEVWKKFETQYEFDYTFLDDQYYQLYKSEERLLKIFLLLSSVAIFVACIGVFGLSSFMTVYRLKEIWYKKSIRCFNTRNFYYDVS